MPISWTLHRSRFNALSNNITSNTNNASCQRICQKWPTLKRVTVPIPHFGQIKINAKLKQQTRDSLHAASIFFSYTVRCASSVGKVSDENQQKQMAVQRKSP
jgi:hypothetical protein